MKSNYLVLVLAASVLTLVSASAGELQNSTDAVRVPPGPPDANLRVRDGEGRDLGTFLSLDRLSRHVLVQNDKHNIQLWIDRYNGGLENSNGSILYELPDCQGQPWGLAADVGRLQGPLVGTEQYFVVADEAVLGLAFVSRRQIFGSCQNSVPPSQLNDFNARMIEFSLDELGYTFPVAMPVRIDTKKLK